MRNRKIKIALIITRLDAGGSADVTLQLARGLRNKGYDVYLASGITSSPSLEIEDFCNRNRIKYILIKELVRDINPILDFIAFLKLYFILKSIKPNIVHTNTSKAGIIGRISAKLAGCGKTLHSPHGHIFYGYYPKTVTLFFIMLEKIVSHYTKYILNLTELGRLDHIKMRIARPEKFIVVGCGVDINKFALLKKNKGHKFTVTWIGRLTNIKNPFMLLEAVKLINQKGYNFKFDIIGDGEILDDCKRYALANNLKNVVFHGYSSGVEKFLANSDLLVVTSKNEGFGRVIIEAMAAGVPIVATKVGGIPDLIKHNINGILIPSESAEMLAKSIIELYKNPHKREMFIEYNKTFCLQYSIENYVNKIEKIYNKVLHEET
ncbi:MAG: glycosyltransferase family 4 protein [Candidatus Marinimicrobia bacterium]|nr:glycosyltransferase family 4 protein [Candidatus Neomarinimicrobiota bacterium]